MSGLAGLKTKALDYYQSKTDSEQKLLLALSVFVIFFVLITSYNTVADGLTETEKKLAKQLELNNWASEQIKIINASGAKTSVSSKGSLTQKVNSSARRYGIKIARLQPQKNDSVRVGLDEVPFNELLKWLANMQNNDGIRVSSIDFSRSDKSGLIKVRRLDLERG